MSDPRDPAIIATAESLVAAAVLRLAVALREIAALHTVRSGTGGDWDTDPPAICNECSDLYPCDTVRALARGLGINPETETR